MKFMKKLKTYDIEYIVKNILTILMFINIILVTIILSASLTETASITFIESGIYKLPDILLWPISIITYIVTIIYFVAAIKSKKEKFSKLLLAITSLFSNVMSIGLLAIWLSQYFE